MSNPLSTADSQPSASEMATIEQPSVGRPPTPAKKQPNTIRVAPVLVEPSQKNTGEVFTLLNTSPSGLTQSQVQQRLSQYGPNEVAQAKRHGWPYVRLARPVVACFLLAIFLTACGKKEENAAPSGKPLVVASFFPLYDFARAVGGADFQVVCLVPPGADPHEMEATPDAARDVANADLVLLLGLGMDGWVEKLATAEHKIRIVHLGEGLPTHKMGKALLSELADESTRVNPDEIDPHVWLDPVLAREIVQRIATVLVEIAPAKRAQTEARRDAYLGELDKLDQEYKDATAHFKQREVVTFHGAFGYLFARYGLRVAGVIEEFPGKEPSAAYLRALVETMRGLHQRVIFAEPELPDQAAKIIAGEVGGRVEKLDSCETILPDNPNITYLERQRRNIQVLRDSLGTAPE